MHQMILKKDNFILKIAESEAEISAAQRLRYRVFVEEMGARPTSYSLSPGREVDRFDPYFKHLILQDTSIADDRENVVGVYRLMQGGDALFGPGYYSSNEFDLSKLINSKRSMVELGRSCVDARYRNGLALHLLWKGVADFVVRHDIELLFGVASFRGNTVETYADGLSFLHHNHLAPEELRVRAVGSGSLNMGLKTKENLNRLDAVRQIPTLIKSYLRLGGFVGENAFVDRTFNTIDVCLILDRRQVTPGALAHLTQSVAA